MANLARQEIRAGKFDSLLSRPGVREFRADLKKFALKRYGSYRGWAEKLCVHPDPAALEVLIEKRTRQLEHLCTDPEDGDPRCSFTINGDTLDNRRVNLRIASHQNNVRNRRNRKPTRTGYKGVWPNVANGRKTGRFTAIIRVSPKKRIHLGSYDTPEEAAKVYDAAATAYFGAFANLNFQLPQEDICA